LSEIAGALAQALVRVSAGNNAARLSLPLVYPGGAMVGVEISRLRGDFLVSDAGGARREAGLLGGERSFYRIASEVAQKFSVRFDRNMFFDLNVKENQLISAVVAVANAAQTAVENTAIHLASVEHADFREYLWDRLQSSYGPSVRVERKPYKFKGSAEQWDFDAGILMDKQISLFEIVTPNANSVNSAVIKFLDVRDLGEHAPHRVAVLTNKDKTPRLTVLSRTARTISVDAPDEDYRRAA
jgi:hypothetical protein